MAVCLKASALDVFETSISKFRSKDAEDAHKGVFAESLHQKKK